MPRRSTYVLLLGGGDRESTLAPGQLWVRWLPSTRMLKDGTSCTRTVRQTGCPDGVAVLPAEGFDCTSNSSSSFKAPALYYLIFLHIFLIHILGQLSVFLFTHVAIPCVSAGASCWWDLMLDWKGWQGVSEFLIHLVAEPQEIFQARYSLENCSF